MPAAIKGDTRMVLLLVVAPYVPLWPRGQARRSSRPCEMGAGAVFGRLGSASGSVPSGRDGAGLPGSGTAIPASVYSFSLLRRVRMEMPRIFAAWVRFPRQWSSVSRMRSCSTSATVRPTRPRVTASAACTARAAGSEDAAAWTDSPSGVVIASAPISGPVARRTARWMVFSSSRTLPFQGLFVTRRLASAESGRTGKPFASAYFRVKRARVRGCPPGARAAQAGADAPR